MRVVPVPCLKDNYAYLLVADRVAVVVDPSEAAPVEAALVTEACELGAIWLTHHHHDHVGGVRDLAAARPGLEIVASATDAAKIEGVTRRVAHDDTVSAGPLRARVHANPGHTLGGITFVVDDAAFTGDTLFCAGCGRLFEGDAQMMLASLDSLATLPPKTRVFCGHEYTASNLKFAAAVEPDNAAIRDRATSLSVPSVGATLAVERATNPFLRVREPAVIAAATARGASADPVSVFAAIRTWKDGFR